MNAQQCLHWPETKADVLVALQLMCTTALPCVVCNSKKHASPATQLRGGEDSHESAQCSPLRQEAWTSGGPLLLRIVQVCQLRGLERGQSGQEVEEMLGGLAPARSSWRHASLCNTSYEVVADKRADHSDSVLRATSVREGVLSCRRQACTTRQTLWFAR